MVIAVEPQSGTAQRFDGENSTYLRAVQDIARERAFARDEGQITSQSIPPAMQSRPVGNLPGPVQTAGEPTKILSIQEWGAMNHPLLAKSPWMLPGMAESLQEEYRHYVEIEMAQRNFNLDRTQTNVNVSGANLRIAKESAGRNPRDPRNIPGNLPAQIGQSIITGQPQEIVERLKKLAGSVAGGAGARGKMKHDVPEDVYQRAAQAMSAGRFKDPDVVFMQRTAGIDPLDPMDVARAEAFNEFMTTGRAGPATNALRNLQTKPTGIPAQRFSQEMLGFEASAGGAAGILKKDPVKGFVQVFKRMRLTMGAADPIQRQQISQTLQSIKPTPQQVIAARNAGQITPDEEREINGMLFQLASQEERAAMARAIVNRQQTETSTAIIKRPKTTVQRLRKRTQRIKEEQRTAPIRKAEAAKLKAKTKAGEKKTRIDVRREQMAIKNLRAGPDDNVQMIPPGSQPSRGPVVLIKKKRLTPQKIRELVAQGYQIPGLDDQTP